MIPSLFRGHVGEGGGGSFLPASSPPACLLLGVPTSSSRPSLPFFSSRRPSLSASSSVLPSSRRVGFPASYSRHSHLPASSSSSSCSSASSSELLMMGQKNGADRVHSSQASNGSNDFNNFGWRHCPRTSFAQQQVVNALRIGDREKASKLLLNIGHVNGFLSVDDFAYILEYCAQTPDPLFIMETWEVMKDKAVGMNRKSCRFIIEALSKGGYLKEALNWLTSLGENDHVNAALPMFNILLAGCGIKKSLKDADYCLELMESQHVGKSEITYWELLKLAVMQENLSAVHEIWKDCTRYYSPSIITLRKFVRSFTKLGDLESAYNVLQLMMAIARQESASVTISATGRYRSSRLDIPIPLTNNSSGVRYLLDTESTLNMLYEGSSTKADKGSKEVCMDVTSCGNQLPYNITGNLKSERTAENQPDLPDASNVLFTETLGSRFIDSVESGRSNSQMFPAVANAIGTDNLKFAVKPDERTKFSNEKTKLVSEMASPPTMNFLRWSFNDMLHACAWSNNFQLAEQLFLQMHNLGVEPSQHSYDGFVKAVINGKGVAYGMKVDVPERAVRVLTKMKRRNINSNIRTYELMFSLFGTVNVPYEKGNMLSHADVVKRIKTIEMDMMMMGIRHSYRSMQNLIGALGAEGMIQEMFAYLNVSENMFWQTDPYQKSDMYNIVLHALVKAKESHRAIEVFKNMRSCGLPANVATYNIMIECCSILTCFKSACALVSLMIRDGFRPQLLTYTALIKVLLANENFEGALHLLDQARSEGIHSDIQLFNTILREASLKGQIDIVERVIEGILRAKIQPNPSTLWYTFSAYVECGFHNTAMEALQVLCMQMISEENILHEKRIAYEDLVHNEGPDVELEIIEIFKESQEYIATALLNLRWCAITGCSISWSSEESLWAKRLSSSYGASKGSA
ncbi:pentatricopeptide repeat-containing protein At1g76280 isoform X2 [Elaeis guineensis]|uniref:Pentatricopeptide repeat-containing protein At1g76280 isoform X2 n=1 Tax=Elaeis guineensis var. tenera TaxID=51953 RepID=A0A6J0PBG2_ELAGV|nr:pentatricopeptide repeat-containing protein At1g76280 isoform X2 [Elaeis guineensis]